MALKRNHEKSALQAESTDGASLEARAYGALRDILIKGANYSGVGTTTLLCG
jgi:hypothetical protein